MFAVSSHGFLSKDAEKNCYDGCYQLKPREGQAVFLSQNKVLGYIKGPQNTNVVLVIIGGFYIKLTIEPQAPRCKTRHDVWIVLLFSP